MNIDVIEQEYLDAVSEVYKIVDEISSNPLKLNIQLSLVKKSIASFKISFALFHTETLLTGISTSISLLQLSKVSTLWITLSIA